MNYIPKIIFKKTVDINSSFVLFPKNSLGLGGDERYKKTDTFYFCFTQTLKGVGGDVVSDPYVLPCQKNAYLTVCLYDFTDYLRRVSEMNDISCHVKRKLTRTLAHTGRLQWVSSIQQIIIKNYELTLVLIILNPKDMQVFYEVVVPLLEMDRTSLLCISTVLGASKPLFVI